MIITQNDRTRIGAAVTKAESTTSGEIVVVLAQEVSSYRDIPLAWASAAALFIPALAVWLGLGSITEALNTNGWSAAHLAATRQAIMAALSTFIGMQAVVFLLVYLLVAWTPVRRALTPAFIKRARTHTAAMGQFLATELDGSDNRTGIVIFVAHDDHVVEVIADRLIHKAVGANAWTNVVQKIRAGLKRSDLASGMEDGIALCGELLTQHFPQAGGGDNTLPDAPRII